MACHWFPHCRWPMSVEERLGEGCLHVWLVSPDRWIFVSLVSHLDTRPYHRTTGWWCLEGTSGNYLVQPPAEAGPPRADWKSITKCDHIYNIPRQGGSKSLYAQGIKEGSNIFPIIGKIKKLGIRVWIYLKKSTSQVQSSYSTMPRHTARDQRASYAIHPSGSSVATQELAISSALQTDRNWHD